MTKESMIKVFRYKAEHIKTKIKPEFFADVADVLEQQPCEDAISREYLVEHIKACWTNGRPRCSPDLSELLSWIDDVPFVQPKSKTEKCKWIRYDYRTICPQNHDVNNPYWRIPEDRMDTLKYCPYCGKEIEVES